MTVGIVPGTEQRRMELAILIELGRLPFTESGVHRHGFSLQVDIRDTFLFGYRHATRPVGIVGTRTAVAAARCSGTEYRGGTQSLYLVDILLNIGLEGRGTLVVMAKIDQHEVASLDALLHVGPFASVIGLRRGASPAMILHHQLVLVEPFLRKEAKAPLPIPSLTIRVGAHCGVANIESHRFASFAELTCR